MEDVLSQLNDAQKKALLQTEGAVLVTAGAGSGKTRLLTHRIAYLIKEKQVLPYNILAITFTNKAAREMKERCEKMIETGSSVWISTFHSMCARILRTDIEQLEGFDRNFTIYSEQDSDKVLKNLFQEQKIEKDEIKKSISFHISNIKNNNLTLDEYEKLYGHLSIFPQIKKTFVGYEQALKRANALDFDDLLNKTYQLFTTVPAVLEKYQNRFKYILVDEFQDTNKIQYDLVKLLAGKYKNIFVVGDEDQCIYTWRGANYSNISDFQRDFPDCKVFKLEQNYRSTKQILNLANSLIKKNKQRLEKTLWTQNEDGNLPEARLVYDEKEEAEIIAREIYDLVSNKGYKYSDFAVLVRLNALTYSFEEKFLAYNIPHRIYGGFKFYERAEIKNLVSYLRLFINPKDDVSFLRIINFPKRGIGQSAISSLQEISEKENLSLLQTSLSISNFASGALIGKLDTFNKVYLSLLSEAKEQGLSSFVSNVIKKFGIKEAYSSGSEEDLNKQLNLDTFVFATAEFEKNNPNGTLLDFLESITLVSDIDTMDSENNAVSIATIHSVKGLEFRYVFIAGLEEKIFPISRAYDRQEEMEEERRLMYVAITRAKENLMLTRCRTRFLYGRREYQIDSRFLKELDLSRGRDFSEAPLSVGPKVYFKDEEYSKPETKYSYNPFKQKTKFQEYLEEKPRNKVAYQKGMRVSHPKFGNGEIIGAYDQFVEVNFEKIGVKTLISEIAPLEILD